MSEWIVDWDRACECLRSMALSQLVRDRFGKIGLRIFNLLLEENPPQVGLYSFSTVSGVDSLDLRIYDLGLTVSFGLYEWRHAYALLQCCRLLWVSEINIVEVQGEHAPL